MAQLVVLQWERRRLSGLIAESDGAALRVESRFAHSWPDAFDPLAVPAQAADQVRRLCGSQTAATRKVIVGLSRDDVILRHLEVPEVADEELPDLVRYQAAARSTLPLDQLLLDFLPLPKSPGSVGRPVLAVTAPKSLIQGIQGVLQAAGLEPATITFSSLGLTELVAHRERERVPRTPRAVLGINQDDTRIELVVLSGDQLLYAHAAKLNPDEPAASTAGLLAEISRTVVAAQRLHPQLAIQQAYVAGAVSQQPEWISALQARLGLTVEFLDSGRLAGLNIAAARTTGDVSSLGVLVGLAWGESDRLTPPFDFLHPRQPPAKVNIRKQRLAIGSAAALVIAALAMIWIETTRAGLQREIQALQDREEALDLKLASGQSALNTAKLIDPWEAGNVHQWQHLAALEDLMEGTDRLYLSQYSFTAGQGETLGNVQAVGNAKSREDVVQFQQRLTDTKIYRIQPRQLTQFGNDDEYPQRFDLHADLLPKPKTAALRSEDSASRLTDASNPQHSTLNP